MWKELKVLVIDDNEQRRHDLKVVLDFMGEPAVVASSEHWLTATENGSHAPESFVAAVLGNDLADLDRVLAELKGWDARIPFVLQGEEEVKASAGCFDDILYIGQICDNPSYATLMDTLHRAQRLREAQNRNGQGNNKQRPIQLFRSLVSR